MDSARTTRDEGTFWAPESKAWLWYNDTIEGHAFALRALMELDPADERRHGLVQWLLLHRKLNHWKSTRATAEVIYALVHYLSDEGALEARQSAHLTIGDREEDLIFEPSSPDRTQRVVVVGPEVGPATGRIEVETEGRGFAFASATWHFSTERLPKSGDGDLFKVERRYFRRVVDGREWVLKPLRDGDAVEVGDQIEVQLEITARFAAEYVHLRDPRGSGFEPESLISRYRWDLGLSWYEAVRDSGTDFFFEWLPAGTYTLSHRLRATTAGTFRVSPTVLQSMYAPEFAAHSAGHQLEVSGR
jgi:uncharacterized protein YfaS (alpha-2-macroglobulin family)